MADLLSIGGAGTNHNFGLHTVVSCGDMIINIALFEMWLFFYFLLVLGSILSGIAVLSHFFICFIVVDNAYTFFEHSVW